MTRTFAAVVALACAGGALAQGTFPSRPVTMVVGFAPGGGTDITARIIVKKLSEYIGQSIVVENRPGAGGSIAATQVAKAAPDGYTIHLANVGALSVAPHLNSSLPYNPQRDFAPISMCVVLDNVLVVHPSVRAKTLAEYVKEANERPGGMPYGSSGIGGAGHLAGELLKLMAKANLVHVPYKGGGPAAIAVVSGEVAAMFGGGSVVPLIKSGKLRALAASGRQRYASLPELPTIGEIFPGYEVTIWQALFAPAGTPPAIVDRLRSEVNAVLARPDVAEKLIASGSGEPSIIPLADFSAMIRNDYEKYGKVIREIGLKVDD